MTLPIPRFVGAIWLLLLLSIVLNYLPFSGAWALWHPDWVTLALIHMALTLRQNTSLLIPFFVGLITDAMSSSLMGLHAFGYVLLTYMSVRLGLRMNAEAFLQQIALVFVTIILFMFIILRVQGTAGHSDSDYYWLPLLGSLVAWPFYSSLLDYFYVKRKPS